MPENVDSSRPMLRHTLATLAYRGGKALRDVPPGFADFSAGGGTRTAGRILAHLGDLLGWGLALAEGRSYWRDSEALPWEQGVNRFFEELARFDAFVASEEPLAVPAAKLFQGPVADALTHVGQIALLRRMAGAPVRGENYFLADILVGTVGPLQASPRKEFD